MQAVKNQMCLNFSVHNGSHDNDQLGNEWWYVEKANNIPQALRWPVLKVIDEC